MTEKFVYSELLAHNATGLERAHVDVDAPAMMATPVDAITSMWDASLIPEELLPSLAFAMGVNLYESIWTTDQRREWVANNWKFLSLRGKLAGVKMALGASGYTVQEVVRPPQGFYLSEAMSKAEIDAWIALMPSIRVTYADRTGQDNGQFFLSDGFLGDAINAFIGVDMGWELYGRLAVLRQNGVDIPLKNISVRTSLEEMTATSFEQYSVPGLSTQGFFLNDSALGGPSYLSAGEIEAEVLSLRIDSAYDHLSADVSLNTIVPGLEPIDVRQVITSDIGDGGPFVFTSGGFLDADFIGPNTAPRMLADTVYLFDPNVSVEMARGASYLNADRLGIDLRTIEMMIDLNTHAKPLTSFLGDTFLGGCYLLPEDTEHEDRAIRAVEASRGLLDRALVRFDTKRPLNPTDPITEVTRAGEWVKNSL